MNGGYIGNTEEVGVGRGGLDSAIRLLEKQREEGLHHGAQLFIARKGIPLLDIALGEAQPGVPLGTDSVMFWYSATKPLTAVAIAQQIERGKLKLDDRVQSYIWEFANGKETATVRQVLTHTGGFPLLSIKLPYFQYSWDEMIQAICKQPAEWEPGTAAGYHPISGWSILGEIVRRVDGRPIEIYIDEEIFKPLGMNDSSLGISEARGTELGKRLVCFPSKPYFAFPVEALNDSLIRSRILPGASGYGPAHDLGRFYLALWNGGEWEGTRILKKETVALFTATQRKGMIDRTFSELHGIEAVPSWGFGFQKGTDEPISVRYGRLCTSAAYGHGGANSSVAFVEPKRDLVVVIVTNGLQDIDNVHRLGDISDLIHSSCR